MIEVKLTGRGVDGLDRLCLVLRRERGGRGGFILVPAIAYILTWYDMIFYTVCKAFQGLIRVRCDIYNVKKTRLTTKKSRYIYKYSSSFLV